MRKILTNYESKIYNQMIAIAHSMPLNRWYTTADLLAQIDHALSGQQQKYLGTRFSYYTSYHNNKFVIKQTSGNNKYQTQ